MESTITVKGQATIPKAIRDHLHVKPGDKVKFFILPDGGVYMLPVVPLSSLRGMLRPRRKGVTLEDMDKGIAAGIVGRYKRAVGMKR